MSLWWWCPCTLKRTSTLSIKGTNKQQNGVSLSRTHSLRSKPTWKKMSTHDSVQSSPTRTTLARRSAFSRVSLNSSRFGCSFLLYLAESSFSTSNSFGFRRDGSSSLRHVLRSILLSWLNDGKERSTSSATSGARSARRIKTNKLSWIQASLGSINSHGHRTSS